MILALGKLPITLWFKNTYAYSENIPSVKKKLWINSVVLQKKFELWMYEYGFVSVEARIF